MGPRPWRPKNELAGALERGDLKFAIMLAREVGEDARGPLDLDLALRFLPLMAVQRTQEYDTWALRWLSRWISETPGVSIDQTAEVAGALAELPSEPSAFEGVRRLTRTSV